MGAEPESRYVRAACPSVLDCLSCGGFSGSPWGWLRLAFSLLVGCSLCSVSDVTLSLAWAGCFLLPLCGLFLFFFVSPSICALTAVIFCFLVSAVFQYYFLLATIFFCSSTIFVSLRFSSVLLLFSFRYGFLLSFSAISHFLFPAIFYFPFPAIFYLSFPAIFYLSFPALFCFLFLRPSIYLSLRSSIFLFLRSSIFFSCDLLFIFSFDLLSSFPVGFFRFPRFRAGFLSSFWGTQAGMNARGLAPAGFVPGRSPWTGSRSRHLRPPTFYSISWWRSRGPATSSGVPPLLCAAIARFTSLPARYYVVTFF